MKFSLLILFVFFSVSYVAGQSLIGTWQLVNQTSCIDDELGEDEEDTQELLADMKSRNSGTNSVIRFKDNANGEENVRMIGSRKSTRMNSFMYKFDGSNIYLLDKKSKLLLGSYIIESITSDSLIVSNAARVCDMKVFVKISDKK